MTQKNTKIAHISTPLTWRGGEQQIAYLYKGIEEFNALVDSDPIEQWIFCPEGSEMESRCQKNKWNYKTFKKRSGTDPVAAFQLKNWCVEEEIQLLHAHDSHAHTMVVLAGSLFRNSVPIVLSRRVDFPPKNKAKTRFKYNYKHIRKILCVSDCIRKMVMPIIHNDAIDVQTVHSGVETQKKNSGKAILREEYGIAKKTRIVANVAALAPHKDYFTFLDTAALLLKEEPELQFFIIGSGPMEQEIRQYAKRLNLGKNILFTGFRKDLDRIWPDIDVLLFTSETEGLGTSILDAFKYGIPVVATNAGGIPEIIEDSKSGLLANVKDAHFLAKKVLELLNDKDLYQQIRTEANERLMQFDRKNTARQTILHYRDVLK